MNKYWEHFKTISKHKILVGYYCCKAGQIKRGLLHDNSKFGPTEFFSSARYFQGTGSPIDKEKAEKGYRRSRREFCSSRGIGRPNPLFL